MLETELSTYLKSTVYEDEGEEETKMMLIDEKKKACEMGNV